MKFNKRLQLEVHRYAPELNALLVGGRRLPAPGAQTIREARKRLGFLPAPVSRFVCVCVCVSVPEPYDGLSRSYQGRVSLQLQGWRDVHVFVAGRKQTHNLPGTTFRVESELVG